MDKKKRYVQIDRPEHNGYFCPIREIAVAVESELIDSEVVEKLILTVIEMTDEEVKELPEFTGW